MQAGPRSAQRRATPMTRSATLKRSRKGGAETEILLRQPEPADPGRQSGPEQDLRLQLRPGRKHHEHQGIRLPDGKHCHRHAHSDEHVYLR